MDFSLFHMWQQMGAVAKVVVVLLAIMSVYSMAVAVERWFCFRTGRIRSLGYLADIQKILGTKSGLKGALGVDERWQGSPVAKVIGSGVKQFVHGVNALETKSEDLTELEFVVEGVSRSMERVRDREVANLKRGLSALATISSSAPFVGLFGTVFGIITAFQNMADPGKGGGGLATVSAGISEALLTTAVGLAVAIVSVWFYNYFIARVDDLTIDVDETTGEILESMLREVRALAVR